MNVTAVESSTLATVAYDTTRERLKLEFNSSSLYQYFGVPAMIVPRFSPPSKTGIATHWW